MSWCGNAAFPARGADHHIAHKHVHLLLGGHANRGIRDLHRHEDSDRERQGEQRQGGLPRFAKEPAHAKPDRLRNPGEVATPGVAWRLLPACTP